MAFLTVGTLLTERSARRNESRRGGRYILAGPLRELAPLISVLPVSAVCWAFPVFWQARQRAFVKLCRQLRTGPGRGKRRVVPHYRRKN